MIPITIIARDGFYYTNGEIYGTMIVLAKSDKIEDWIEVEKDKIEEYFSGEYIPLENTQNIKCIY